MVKKRENSERYTVSLGELFEGPMDLLVHLVRKNRVDIYDVPIARITDQYLAYIDLLKSMQIDPAGDFLVMAATLTQMKSRLLLPVHQGEEEETDDLYREITGPLIEYIQMKTAAEQLSRRELLGEEIFTRAADPPEGLSGTMEPELIPVGLFELIDAFRRILDNVSEDAPLNMFTEHKSVQDKMTELVDLLEEKETVTFDALFRPDDPKSELIVTFLAVLEMVKLELIRLVQSTKTGIIRLFYQ